MGIVVIVHHCVMVIKQVHRVPYLHISSVFLHVTDGDALVAVDGDSPSLVDITLGVVVWITPLQLIRVT